MRKLFSISRKQVTILITLVAVVAAGALYYLSYIPNNEEHLNEQHFRWLQKTDANIRAKMLGNDTLLSNLLQAYIDSNNKNQNVEDYISHYPIGDATLAAYKTDSLDSSGKKTLTQTKKPKPDTSGTQFILDWDSSMNKLKLSAVKKEQDGIEYTVQIKYDFEKFIAPLLIPGLFDHYIIFYEGRYIYEDFHSGLGYNQKEEDSLLKTGKAMTGANIIDQKVGGIDYKIFFQPVNFFNDKKLLIAGLLSQKEMNAEKKQLPPGIAVLTITIGLGILLFLPWIKIYFQGKYDKVNLRDAAESVVVAKLLISLIVLLFFTYNYSFRPDIENRSKNLLADTVAERFNKEIKMAEACLVSFDSVMNHDSMFYDIINLGTDSGKFTKHEEIFNLSAYEQIPQKDILKNICNKLEYFEINWLDSNGKLKYGWTKSAQNNIHATYKDRNYFKKIKNDGTISLGTRPGDSFALDQVVSRTSGSFRTITSKKSVLATFDEKEKRAKVVALSFMMKSLDSVIMPAGYSFAIIDESGSVRYHSKMDRNLNENLLEEFANNQELKDALHGRFIEHFNTKYYEGDYSILVKPLKDFPYFIVIMGDKSYPGIVQVETFSFTWGMILVFMIVVALDLFILIVSSSRRSLFKKQYLVTSWLWPRAGSSNEYFIAGVCNAILIVFLIIIPVFHFHFNYLRYLFLLFFCIPLSTIFINSLFLYKYKIAKNEAYQRYKVRSNRYTLFFLILLNVLAWISLGFADYWLLIITEAVLVLAGLILFNFYKRKTNTANDGSFLNFGYVGSYTFMTFTRLIITSAIPAVFFYIASNNFENNLLARYRLYDYVNQLHQKFPGKILPDTHDFRHAIYIDGFWIDSISATTESSVCDCTKNKDSLSVSQEHAAGLFNSFGFYLEGISSVNNDNFYKSASDDGSFCYNNFFDDVLCSNKGNRLCTDLKSNRHLSISSKDLNYTFPSIIPHKGFLFWLILAGALFSFYKLLSAVIRKVCSLNFEHIPFSNETGKPLQDLLGDNEQPLMWVVGLPAIEIADKLKQEVGPANTSPYLDFNNIVIDDRKSKDIKLAELKEITYLLRLKSDEEKESSWDKIKSQVFENDRRFVFILNIENSLNDAGITKEKIDCIKTLLDDKRKKVVIVSEMHPSRIEEILSRKYVGEQLPDTETIKLMNLIFNNSSVVMFPLIENDYAPPEENVDNKPIQLFLNEETRRTEFLKQLRSVLLNQGIKKTKKFAEDKLTLRIQMIAGNLYINIWRSLSSDEKFVLYDLALDGLVNITNTVAVSMLINKGLIVEEEGHLHIFNRSFRHFIVSSVDDKEIAHLQAMNKRHSNWSNLQGPLLLVVLATFIFLAIAQEGLYSKIIGVVTGIAAGIPALLKLLSVVGIQNDKSLKK
jgi:hypothetical protein